MASNKPILIDAENYEEQINEQLQDWDALIPFVTRDKIFNEKSTIIANSNTSEEKNNVRITIAPISVL